MVEVLFFLLQVNRDNDDGGILSGLWSANDEDYADGTDPTAWSGSSAIIEEYVASKMPIKYAQCWVFGGTLTTGEAPAGGTGQTPMGGYRG